MDLRRGSYIYPGKPKNLEILDLLGVRSGIVALTKVDRVDMDRIAAVSEEIEAELRSKLGVRKVVWLPLGIAADFVTDGHVDAVATFAAPGLVLLQGCTDPADPDFERNMAEGIPFSDATRVKVFERQALSRPKHSLSNPRRNL